MTLALLLALGCSPEPSSDCAPDDPSIGPRQAEVCDGIDNDCDGLIDDEDEDLDLSTASTWFYDGDRDGYGKPETTKQACVVPPAFVDNAEDCDDLDPELKPQTWWYRDWDQDGYGETDSAVQHCDERELRVRQPGDCDDYDADANPGLLEQCDGIDNNCDGVVDEYTATDAGAYYPDDDGDGFGRGGPVISCTPPADHATAGGDCDDDDPLVNPGERDRCDGVDNDCDGGVDHPYNVGREGDWATLQAAIDGMPDGASACVDAGTYRETLDFGGKSLGFHGAGTGQTVVDGGGGQILDLLNRETVVLTDLDLTNGYDTSGGIAHVDHLGSLSLIGVEIHDAGCASATPRQT